VKQPVWFANEKEWHHLEGEENATLNLSLED
jgi:hypothetical protein